MPADSVQPFPYWIVTFDGLRLRQHRRDGGLSQERPSHRSHISFRTIQRVEQLSAANCHVGTLQRLASTLSSGPDTLICELTGGFAAETHAAQPRGPVPRPRVEPWWQRANPFPAGKAEHGCYDTAMARELLAIISELPDTKAVC